MNIEQHLIRERLESKTLTLLQTIFDGKGAPFLTFFKYE